MSNIVNYGLLYAVKVIFFYIFYASPVQVGSRWQQTSSNTLVLSCFDIAHLIGAFERFGMAWYVWLLQVVA